MRYSDSGYKEFNILRDSNTVTFTDFTEISLVLNVILVTEVSFTKFP